MSSAFRPDIQGLRAIAVLAVLIYHIWPEVLPGGYVGVDVFFVISGFLITGLLVREFERSGTVSLVQFYARRIRRLLPAAGATLLAVAIAGFVWLSVSEWRPLSRELLASAFYFENWLLVSRSVDYLAQDAAPSALQHFWSLSVEEQFYIIWPLLMLLVGGIARRFGWAVRTAFKYTLLGLCVASFCYGVYASFVDPAPAYFSTLTRVWELGIGGLLALWGGLAKSPAVSRVSGLIGLGAIFFACVFYSSRLPFPGYEALVPVLGAALLIFASLGDGLFIGRLLRTRPMQYIGDVSYSLYLWHWPIVVFYPVVTGQKSDTMQDGIFIFALSVAIAHVSKYRIEEVFRVSRPGERWRPFVLGGVVSFAILVCAQFLVIRGDREAASSLYAASASSAEHPGALALEGNGKSPSAATNYIPAAGVARVDRGPAYGLDGSERCIGNEQAEDLSFCSYGSETAPLHVVIVGDSHAVHWLPALELMAATENIRVTGLTKSSCAFTSVMTRFAARGVDRPYEECQRWGRKVVDWLEAEKPDLVVVSFSPRQAVPGRQHEESQQALASGVVTYARELNEAGLKVAAIKQTPWQVEDVPLCMAKPGATIGGCSTNKREALSVASLELASKQFPDLKLLDFDRYFCQGDNCPAVIGGVLVYRDKHHMTATYARSMAPVLSRSIHSVFDGK